MRNRTGEMNEVQRLIDYLLAESYDHIFLLKVRENTVSDYRFGGEAEEMEERCEIPDADEWLVEFFDRYRAADDRFVPAEQLRLPLMRAKLESRERVGEVCPVYEGGELRRKYVEYRYYDAEKNTICLTVRDVTELLEAERQKAVMRFEEDFFEDHGESTEAKRSRGMFFVDESSYAKCSVLIAGADSERSAKIASMLGKYGVTVDYTGDGRQALERLVRSTAGEYDILFADANLPGMGGVELTRQLRLSRRMDLSDLSIVLLSDTEQRDTRIGALEVGADYHLFYPVDSNTIIEVLFGEIEEPTTKKAYELRGFKVIK